MANKPIKGWRQGSTSADRSKAGGSRQWQQGDPLPGGRKPMSRSTKIGLALFSSIAVIAVMVWVIYLLRPIREVRLVLVDAGGYETNLAVPVNAAGRQGLLDLESWARTDPRIEVKKGDLTSQSDSLAKAIDGPRARTVIVYVNAHGGVDGTGAYFFPQDANLKDRNQVQRLDALLSQLKQMPPDTKKLLILDATQTGAYWQAGMVHNDFYRQLQADPRLKEIDNLLIISSSDENQRSWVSEEWRRSIFTHYLIEGLRGAADQAGNGDGRTTAAELYNYVHKNVKHWVRHNREALQEPQLLGSKQLAQDMELVAVDSSYAPASAASVPTFTVPTELQNAWTECDRLRQSTPSPAVYTPHLWRQYLDTLLRYEQLVRSDDNETGPLLTSLNHLKDRIIQAQRLERDSLQTSLAMPAALGWKLPAPLEQRLKKEFDRNWEERAEPEAYKKMLAELKKQAANKWQGQLLRVRLSGLLVNRAIKNPDPELKNVAGILPVLDEAIGVRPAEAHYLVMLQRDLSDKPPKAELLGKALYLRQLAEEAALGASDAKTGAPSYCEQVYPWIRKKVEEADQERRLGQDLLFAEDAKSWAEAEKHLKQAQDLYQSAQKEALDLRMAMQARDELFVELPYFTQWLAHASSPDDPQEAVLLDLWKNLHELQRLLDNSDLKEPTDKLVPLVAEKSDVVNKAMNGLRSALKQRSEERNPVLQKRWHEIEALLLVPFLEPATRLDLLRNSRQISHKLNVETDRAAEQPGLTPDKNNDLARAAAQRQSRLALAVLGKDRFTRNQPDFDTLEGWIKKSDDGQWWRTFDRVGEQVGKQWSEMGQEAEKLTTTARQADLNQSAAQLRSATQSARQLNGAQVVTWLGTDLDPMGDKRRLQFHDLFCWQADRTFLDHWSSEEPKKPYYRTAGLLLAREAKDLVTVDSTDVSREQKELRWQTALAMEKRLNAPCEVIAKWSTDEKSFETGAAQYQVTDEKKVRCIYGIEAPETMPKGYPVVWAKKGAGLAAPGTGDTERRVARNLDTDPRKSTFVFELVPDPSKLDKTRHTFTGVYRGQLFDVTSVISLQAKPDVIVFQPETPRTARLAVQIEPELQTRLQASASAYAIVLDCSGSMNYQKTKGGPTRFEKALDALKQIMQDVPSGATVSFRAFSQKGDETLESLLIRPARVWNPNQLRDFMKSAQNLDPLYETPLVKAIWKARKDFPANFRGTRTIVVLTDGADNQFKKDLRLQEKGATISQFMDNEFRGSNILINVVGFEVTPQEKKEQKEFADAIRNLDGNYYDADDSKQLVEYLRKAMLEMHFWIEPLSGSIAKGQLPPGGVNVSTVDQNFRWIHGLEPGTYNLRVRTDQAYEQVVRVEAGDSLVVDLVSSGEGLVFRRNLYAESSPLKKNVRKFPKNKINDWTLAVLQNERTGPDLHLMTTLEKDQRAISRKESLRQIKPGFSWFQVTAGEKGMPVPNVRVFPLPAYPATAWSLDIEPWPAGVTPSLEVWWHDDEPKSAGRLVRDRGDFKTLEDLTGKELELTVVEQEESAKITVEKVYQERITIDTPFDREKKKDDVDCLVVRLRYPPGKPFFVRLPESLEVAGYQHRFFDQAGRYTGIFWNVTQDQARALKSLDFVSVEGAKRKATYHQEKLDLGNFTARRPQRPNE